MTENYEKYFEWCEKENKNPYSEKVAREFQLLVVEQKKKLDSEFVGVLNTMDV